ncbi:MAG: hypothetical protein H0V47_02025 [Chloroflexia bacterium]|nr:hypothetical protein [Chloroflexia bacterium]
MNDIPSPLVIMHAEEYLRDLERRHGGQPRRPEMRRTLHFPPIRRTIGLTLIRTGQVLAGAQPNGV